MPTKVRRAVAPHKVLRQIERSAMKDLNIYLLKAKRLAHDIVDKSQPDPTQMTLGGAKLSRKVFSIHRVMQWASKLSNRAPKKCPKPKKPSTRDGQRLHSGEMRPTESAST